MDKPLQELSEVTFKQAENVSISDLSLDIKMTKIFWAMDGSRDHKTVAREDAGKDVLGDLAQSISRMQNSIRLAMERLRRSRVRQAS